MTNVSSVSEPFILFELAGATYGIRSKDVAQVEMVESITPIPDAAQSVEGVILSRGQVIPAVNLRLRFGFERVPFTIRSRLIIVNVCERTVGFIVDSAREFTAISHESILPPPEEISGLSGRYLKGVATLGERVVLILHTEEVLRLADGTRLALEHCEPDGMERSEDGEQEFHTQQQEEGNIQ